MPRFLTDDIAGIGGAFKVSPEDFVVHERPLYEFSGEGEHTLVHIEKTGISTFEASKRLCQAVGFREADVGSAGLKDARATARQWLSFQLVDPAKFAALDIPGIRILEITRHNNKLRRGHLAGNTFTCVLRNVDPAGEERARAILARLADRGVPNHFGNQRFGAKADTHRLGRFLLKGSPEGLVRELLGRPENETDPDARMAREAFEAGDLDAALELMPHRRNQERRLLNTLWESGGSAWSLCVKQLPKKLKKLYVSAYQSWLFNSLLDERLPDLVTLQTGDIAYLHRNGAAFEVADAAVEQPRADAFEISASGPLFGTKVLLANGEPGRRERELLDSEGLALEHFKLPGGLTQTGARRPYRFPLPDAALDWNVPAGDDGAVHATVRFTLGPGCYATNVLAELAKGDQPPIIPEA